MRNDIAVIIIGAHGLTLAEETAGKKAAEKGMRIASLISTEDVTTQGLAGKRYTFQAG